MSPSAVMGADRHFSRSEYIDRKSTRLNSSHANISYAVFCLKKKKKSGRRGARRHLMDAVRQRAGGGADRARVASRLPVGVAGQGGVPHGADARLPTSGHSQ